MRRRALLAPILVAALAAGCGSGGSTPSAPPTATGAPPAGTAATAATPTAAAAADPASARFERVLDGLDQPLGIVTAPGEADRVYVVEQTGLVRVVEGGRLLDAPFLDLSADTAPGGERGLLDIAFDPGWPDVHVVYAHLTDRDGNTLVLRLELAADGGVEGRTTLFTAEQPFANHNGGPLLFGPDGRLYLGLGDGGSAFDPGRRAQDPTVPYGKLLVLDPTRRTTRPLLAATGLRNPWRVAFAPDGSLVIGDVGQGEIEEVDVIPAALLHADPPPNLGWSAYEGDRRIEGHDLVGDGPLLGPAWTYDHGDGRCSITGGVVVPADGPPALAGRYLAGDLCTGDVWSMRLVDGKARDVAHLATALPQVSSFGLDPRGGVLAVTHDGGLWRALG